MDDATANGPPARMTQAEIAAAFERLAAANPAPTTELAYTNPFTLLVAVVLSAQSTDAAVNKATEPLFAEVQTPADMLALGEDGLKRYISSIGLYNSKARNIMKLARALADQHDGQVPQERAALEALPGVGRKTANVVRNTLFGADEIAVDTHVFRVANRTGMAPGGTALAVENGLQANVPQPWKRYAHHWLILHGRYVCKARKPQCGTCAIRDLCHWPEKGDHGG